MSAAKPDPAGDERDLAHKMRSIFLGLGHAEPEDYDRAEKELASYRARVEAPLRAEVERLREQYDEEKMIVDQVWNALGKTTYEECKPYAIWEWVEQLRAKLCAAEKALELSHAEVGAWRRCNMQVQGFLHMSKLLLDEIDESANFRWRELLIKSAKVWAAINEARKIDSYDAVRDTLAALRKT